MDWVFFFLALHHCSHRSHQRLEYCPTSMWRCVCMDPNGSWKQLKMLIRVFYWPSRVHTEHTVSHFFPLKPNFLPFLSTPEAIPSSWEETGSSFMQMTVVSGVAAAPWQADSHYFIHQWREGICMKKEESRSKSLLSTSCCLYSFCQTWQNAGLVGLDTGKVSRSLSFTFWTGARVLLGLLYCAGGKLPIRGSLIEHWKQEFYKGADLLFITSHSLLLSPTLFRFPLAHCATLPFLVFSPAPFIPCSPYPSLLIPPLVSMGLPQLS